MNISPSAFSLLQDIDLTLGRSDDWYNSYPDQAALLTELVDANFLEINYEYTDQYRLTVPGWERLADDL